VATPQDLIEVKWIYYFAGEILWFVEIQYAEATGADVDTF
jgi:hypothetical protein